MWGPAIAAGANLFGSMMMADQAERSGDIAARASDRAIGEQRRQFDLTRQDMQPFIEAGEPAVYQQMGMLGLAEPAVGQLDQRIADLETRVQDFDTGPTEIERLQRDMEQAGSPSEATDAAAALANYEGPATTSADRQDELGDLRNQLQNLKSRRDQLSEAAGADFQTSPGYQFRLNQGTQALQRSQSAKGNRLSGRALKEMQQFGQGMASEEFQNQFSRLGQLAGQGQSAAGTTGQFRSNMAGNVGNLTMQGAQMQSAAGQNRANALSQGITQAGSQVGEAMYTNQLMNRYNNWMNQPAAS